MVKDVVCGFEVNEKTTKFMYEYNGHKFYFCSTECKKTFVNAPEEYLTTPIK